SFSTVSKDQFDAKPCLLNCHSGTIDLRTGKLLPHDPGRLITKLAPVEYDRTAKCPLFDAFLDQIMAGDHEVIWFVLRAIGYSLTGFTTEQCIFLCIGTGANGKTTLIRVIQELLGDYAQQMGMDSLMVQRTGTIPADLARLPGARFVAASEAEAG